MKLRFALLITCLTCCLTIASATSPIAALASTAESQATSDAVTPVSDSLVIPGALTEAEQRQAQEQAVLANPEEIVQREASSTEFEAISREEAANLAGKSFPVLINERNGGPPLLSAGQSIGNYPTNNSAQVDLGKGQHAMLESMVPIAIEWSPPSTSGTFDSSAVCSTISIRRPQIFAICAR